MTKEEKDLLLIDLSARLPYNTLISIADDRFQFIGVHLNYHLIAKIEKYDAWDNIKPYLRSMSSMTEEERRDYDVLASSFDGISMAESIDWLNAHHFDYRGLIPKDLAIEVTESNNPYKE